MIAEKMSPHVYAGLPSWDQKQIKVHRLQDIADTVCNYLDVDLESVKSRTRKRVVVEARQIAMWIALQKTKHSQVVVGAFFGGRDHSTTIYARDTVNDLMDTDKKFKAKVQTILKLVEA